MIIDLMESYWAYLLPFSPVTDALALTRTL